MYTPLFQQLTPQSLVLTPNLRLARHLHQRYDQTQTQHHWTPVTILPLSTWLEQQWLESDDPRYLLTQEQECWRWQQIIRQHPLKTPLFDHVATAKLLQQTYALLQQWAINWQELQDYGNQALTALQTWFTHFDTLLNQQQAIVTCQLAKQLLKQTINVPDTLYLVGFDELTPQVSQLLQQLPCQIEHYASPVIANAQCLACHDGDDELTRMLRWAKQYHEDNPQAHIICVVPQLNQLRSQIQLTVNQLFDPAALFQSAESSDNVNISGGYALATTPLIQIALQLLHCHPQHIDYHQLRELLLSVFVSAGIGEYEQRAQLDALLADTNETLLLWRGVEGCLRQQQRKREFCPQLLAQLPNFVDLLAATTKTQSLADWVSLFEQQLSAIGWPGDRTLNSQEYQQLQHWQALLYRFAQLDDRVDYNKTQALAGLNQLCHDHLFQPQSHPAASIQVLGTLEAAAIDCDALWMMGLHDGVWPAPAQANPFLPAAWQRQWQMPHSSAEKEWQFAQKLTQRFLTAAQQVVFSYPQHEGDNTLQPSPLLHDFPPATQLSLAPLNNLAEQAFVQQQWQTLDDQMAPTITEPTNVRGGSGLFKSQAACPFQAFARYRLQAMPLREPSYGVDALQRGLILHHALDSLWAMLGNQDALSRINDARLRAMIDGAIDKAIATIIPWHSQKMPVYFKHLEQQRLQALLQQWLAVEQQRSPFRVIHREQCRDITLGQIQVRLQVDRIDELANGDQVVIDYKTSQQLSVNHWLNEQLTDPQLPLYCITGETSQAIAFAQVRSDTMSFKGISAHAMGIEGIQTVDSLKQPPWASLVKQWQQRLQQLASDFAAGDARVLPQPGACNYCELGSLCRVHETEVISE